MRELALRCRLPYSGGYGLLLVTSELSYAMSR